MSAKPASLPDRINQALEAGTPIRLDLGNGSRLHIDRPMPFLCVHLARRSQPAARDVAMANAAYLVARNLAEAVAVLRPVGAYMQARFGAFLLLDIGELAQDQLAKDSPYLPPFELGLSAPDDAVAQAALSAFAGSVEAVTNKFRVPRVVKHSLAQDIHASLARRLPMFPVLTVRFAPIYRVPGSRTFYPALRERVVANLFDAGLQAAANFAAATTKLALPSHRALGRRVFIDAVSRADRAMDEVAQSFDFLLAVTPINADAAWQQFKEGGYHRAPNFLYRPLTIATDVQKKALFSIALDHFEDPVLTSLYREKQQELDLQLSMLAARESQRFIEFGRALYGSVEPKLLAAAEDILAATSKTGRRQNEPDTADHAFVERKAQAMIAAYAGQSDAFTATIELRDDLPAGLMVTNGRLLISRSTSMARQRVEALLSHEVGVHLLTYYNGSAQGLRLFRSGLAGYEGAQEGLAVLAEYLAGGMTTARLRLIAARVVACAAMLDGASFQDNFRLLTKELGFAPQAAFNLALRVHRGGGLAKDAIYLRGLLEILKHLESGGALDPFWMGKIAAPHFAVMQELNARGLLKAPLLIPEFLSIKGAEERLAKARSGLAPIDLIAS